MAHRVEIQEEEEEATAAAEQQAHETNMSAIHIN